jgi:hypothetical protein
MPTEDEKNKTIPAEIETIYDHGLTEEERLQWFKHEYFYPRTKEEYLQRLKRYENSKSMLNRIWHDLFTLYFNRGDWAKAKEYLMKIDDKRLRCLIVYTAAGGDIIIDREWRKKVDEYFKDIWEEFKDIDEVWKAF